MYRPTAVGLEAALPLQHAPNWTRVACPSVGTQADGADPLGAALLLGSTICVLAAMYIVCYTFFMANWEGWEAWSRRTGLDAEIAEEERHRRLGPK
jgi:hypothetical protein